MSLIFVNSTYGHVVLRSIRYMKIQIIKNSKDCADRVLSITAPTVHYKAVVGWIRTFYVDLDQKSCLKFSVLAIQRGPVFPLVYKFKSFLLYYTKLCL